MAAPDELQGLEGALVLTTAILALESDPFEGVQGGFWSNLDSPYQPGEGGTATAWVDKDKDIV